MIGYRDKTKDIPEDKYLFSVTSMLNFDNNKSEFFNRVLLNNPTNTISKNTILGTIIHHLIETVLTNKTTSLDEINNYIDSFSSELLYEDLDWVKQKFLEMKDYVVSYYDNRFVKPDKVEYNIIQQVSENVFIGGTLDCLEADGELKDFKTTTQLSQIQTISPNYKLQLHTYAYLLRLQGINVNTLTIEYIRVPETNRVSEITGKPLKDYPCQIYAISELIDEELIENIKNKIQIISEQIEFILKNPNTLWLFAQDVNLKEYNGIKTIS